MSTRTDLNADELAALEQVAEGRADQVSGAEADRLIQIGLVIRRHDPGRPDPLLELSPAGLRHIRSSDQ